MSITKINLQGEPYVRGYGIGVGDSFLEFYGLNHDSRMYFSRDGLRAVGLAALGAAGVEVADIDSMTRASDVSFNEGLIRVAAVHGRTVSFRYAKTATSPIEARRLIPTSVEKHGDAVLFVGEDPDRGGYRSFRLDRIKGDVEVES